MKITTVPFAPFNELSECSLPSKSGSLKSSITVPMAGGAGKSLTLLPLPATAASAIITKDTRTRKTAYCFFILRNSFQELVASKAKINSQKLDVASGGRAAEIRKWGGRNSTRRQPFSQRPMIAIHSQDGE